MHRQVECARKLDPPSCPSHVPGTLPTPSTQESPRCKIRTEVFRFVAASWHLQAWAKAAAEFTAHRESASQGIGARRLSLGC